MPETVIQPRTEVRKVSPHEEITSLKSRLANLQKVNTDAEECIRLAWEIMDEGQAEKFLEKIIAFRQGG